MDAFTVGDEYVILDSDRCIGCGLCVTSCPTEALSLDLREENARLELNDRLQDTWRQISRLQDEH